MNIEIFPKEKNKKENIEEIETKIFLKKINKN